VCVAREQREKETITMTTKNNWIALDALSVGDKFVLYSDDSGVCIAELRDGGKKGGTKHDLYVAFFGEATADDVATLPSVSADHADADACGISL